MIRLFPKIIKMKRVAKVTAASHSTQKPTSSTRRKKVENTTSSNKVEVSRKKEKVEIEPGIVPEIRPKQMHLTRSRKAKQEGREYCEQIQKGNLIKMKLASKGKAQISSLTNKSSAKREHIQVEYDEIISETSKLVEKTPLNMPPNWEEVLHNLQEMSKTFDSSIDYEQCCDDNVTAEGKRFQILLSLMLSSQTKDQVTHAAMTRLHEHGCSLTEILNTSDQKLGELICPVRFWKTKVKYIKSTALMIKDSFNSDIPKTVEDLCKLRGVGPKMAHLCMNAAWGQVTGIGVDTHVHRVTNRLGWVKTKTPDDTRTALENWLPQDLWIEVDQLLVRFGQQICHPLKPQCMTCLNNQLCPFGVKEIEGKRK